MEQIHRRFTAEQAKVLFKAYCQGILDRPAVQETLGIGKARFFALLKQYRHKTRKDLVLPTKEQPRQGYPPGQKRKL